MSEFILGIDVGSISTNLVLLDKNKEIKYSSYIRTGGNPIRAVKIGLKQVNEKFPEIKINGVGTTGSARNLIGTIVGADLIKNEITAHATASSFFSPDIRTILEIGGQDSKLIILRNGVVVDFAMNSVCAAGTGSFLDSQSSRLKIPVEKFGEFALKSKEDVNIAGRCTVFAESDMIHKQQVGHSNDDIIYGLCNSLVRNYLNNLGRGKELIEPIMFQGGVSENKGMIKAFEKTLGCKLIVPKHNKVMGAIGIALLVANNLPEKTKFRGFSLSDKNILTKSFNCDGCPNKCEVIEAYIENELLSRWNDRCGKWQISKQQEN